MPDVKMVGYFNFMDPDPDRVCAEFGRIGPDVKSDVLRYMAASKIHTRYRGMARSRIDGSFLGCAVMQTPDGKFIFPEQWDSHYVQEHDISPGPEFVAAAVEWCAKEGGMDSGSSVEEIAKVKVVIMASVSREGVTYSSHPVSRQFLLENGYSPTISMLHLGHPEEHVSVKLPSDIIKLIMGQRFEWDTVAAMLVGVADQDRPEYVLYVPATGDVLDPKENL